ncbi:hypothetical protein CC80DRAFT_547007 [Byssothecium circinans]|uniref:Uncharacterized protein n=1 Tax=Byssothecium circinans TaxID=147558 RepID=A0A6A5TYK3_9PLEO|nr:hypothetical protein CC80DRAFT_547007 [Byssothecium circinans]
MSQKKFPNTLKAGERIFVGYQDAKGTKEAWAGYDAQGSLQVYDRHVEPASPLDKIVRWSGDFKAGDGVGKKRKFVEDAFDEAFPGKRRKPVVVKTEEAEPAGAFEHPPVPLAEQPAGGKVGLAGGTGSLNETALSTAPQSSSTHGVASLPHTLSEQPTARVNRTVPSQPPLLSNTRGLLKAFQPSSRTRLRPHNNAAAAPSLNGVSHSHPSNTSNEPSSTPKRPKPPKASKPITWTNDTEQRYRDALTELYSRTKAPTSWRMLELSKIIFGCPKPSVGNFYQMQYLRDAQLDQDPDHPFLDCRICEDNISCLRTGNKTGLSYNGNRHDYVRY